jgi:hypothetical protein
MFQVLLPADGGRSPKHVAVKMVYFYMYFLLAYVGFSNRKCDKGNGKVEICGVGMDTVQYYCCPFVHLHLLMTLVGRNM